ncbi:BnaC08g47590D [Brassica napus]|uniref:BnaC08g47590D protein n=1 Tax=Brassica napus TaxID=3708 RepID=A0A078J3U8_BRANA|nr:BnaC08g47590D [Brassica napus]
MRRSCGGESFGVGCAPDDANTSRGFRTFAAASGDLVDVVPHFNTMLVILGKSIRNGFQLSATFFQSPRGRD